MASNSITVVNDKIIDQLILDSMIYIPETGHFIRNTQIAKSRTPKIAGSVDKKGYVNITIFKRTYYGHRLAWLFHTGDWPVYGIDHINGIKHDNRISNLRDVPQSINRQNTKKFITNSKSGLLGANKVRSGHRFSSAITFNGIKYKLGNFNTAYEAHKAYLEAKEELENGSAPKNVGIKAGINR